MYKLKYENITQIAKLKIAYLSTNILINKYIKNKNYRCFYRRPT
jgi:hypothetical protein